MLRISRFLILVGAVMATSGCSSTTLIDSKPSDARLYLNEQYVGNTPYWYTDTKIVGSSTRIKLVKEGYDIFRARLERNEQIDEGALIAGVVLLVPLLWVMEYDPMHVYELTPKKSRASAMDDMMSVHQLTIPDSVPQSEW